MQKISRNGSRETKWAASTAWGTQTFVKQLSTDYQILKTLVYSIEIIIIIITQMYIYILILNKTILKIL